MPALSCVLTWPPRPWCLPSAASSPGLQGPDACPQLHPHLASEALVPALSCVLTWPPRPWCLPSAASSPGLQPHSPAYLVSLPWAPMCALPWPLLTRPLEAVSEAAHGR